MTQTTTKSADSKVGCACLVLFGLPFFCAGIFTIVKGIEGISTSKGKDTVVYLGVGGLFACVGLGIMLLGLFSSRLGKKQRELENRYPDEPWLWREAWKDGIVKSKAMGGAIGIAFFALIWNAISWIMVIMVSWKEELAKNKAVLIALLFPAIGIILIIVFVYNFLRARKYGTSTLHLDTFPGVVGGSFKGTVKIPAQVHPEDGFGVRIVSVEQYVSGTGKNRSTRERTLWEDECTIREFDRRNAGVTFPVAFTIPSSAKATTLGNPGHDVIWRVTVKAATAGIDYGGTFEIPVFVTDDSQDGVEPDDVTVVGDSTEDDATDHKDVRRLYDELGIVMTHPGYGRMTMEFKAGQNKKSTCGFFIFFLIWTGITVSLFMYAPIVFAIFFGFFDAILFLVLLSMLFSSSTIKVNSREIVITKKFIGIGGPKRIRLTDLESIRPVSRMQSGDKHFYELEFKDASGQKISAGGAIPSKDKAKRVIAEIMKVVRENGE